MRFKLVPSPFTGAFVWSRVEPLLSRTGDDVVLVGHSGAGARLPALAAEAKRVAALVYVDALLPHPGRSWAEVVPREFVDGLRSRAVDGRLPPWPQWWGDDAMRTLLPDDAMRERFVADCPSVDVAVLDEVMPDAPEPPSAFVQLSDAYETEADAARAHGWPVIRVDGTHLSMLTEPQLVADAIVAAVDALGVSL